jgi:6-pyruvoyltetrahydropterin/6-carboxytetrahydropterin synthase
VLDFEVMKNAVRDITCQFHYKDLNEHAAFLNQSPSAEAVARYIFGELQRLMGENASLLRRVRVWEAPGCSATYYESA